MEAPALARRLALLERAGVALLLVAAMLPRLRDYDGGFDREFEGFQGAFFAICAINYERLGLGALGGYPVVNIDFEGGLEGREPRESDPSTWYAYANHPPLVPLVAWASVSLFAPDGWQDAWREGRAPEGLEPALRLPFFLCHLGWLLALWWAVREAGGKRLAFLSLAFAIALPVSTLYATLVNYENPSLLPILLGVGGYARWVRRGSRRAFFLCVASFFAAGLVTYAPLFFLAALVLHRLAARRLSQAIRLAAWAGGAVLLPLALHSWHAGRQLAAIGQPADRLLRRIQGYFEPLFDGSGPLSHWLTYQVERGERFLSWPILLVALLGAALAVARGLRPRGTTQGETSEPPTLDLGLPLFGAGAGMLFAYYVHTLDGYPDEDGQVPFLLNLVPGIAVLAAGFLDTLAPGLYRLRAGIAPLVVATSAICLPAVARTHEIRVRWREPGPADGVPEGRGPALPLPQTAGAELAELLPPGSVGAYPDTIGFNMSVFYYAWRTMLPLNRDSSGEVDATIRGYGLEDAPRYVVIPRVPPPRASDQVAFFAPLLEGLGEPPLQTDTWLGWRWTFE